MAPSTGIHDEGTGFLGTRQPASVDRKWGRGVISAAPDNSRCIPGRVRVLPLHREGKAQGDQQPDADEGHPQRIGDDERDDHQQQTGDELRLPLLLLSVQEDGEAERADHEAGDDGGRFDVESPERVPAMISAPDGPDLEELVGPDRSMPRTL